jgi:hypothetical protein
MISKFTSAADLAPYTSLCVHDVTRCANLKEPGQRSAPPPLTERLVPLTATFSTTVPFTCHHDNFVAAISSPADLYRLQHCVIWIFSTFLVESSSDAALLRECSRLALLPEVPSLARCFPVALGGASGCELFFHAILQEAARRAQFPLANLEYFDRTPGSNIGGVLWWPERLCTSGRRSGT